MFRFNSYRGKIKNLARSGKIVESKFGITAQNKTNINLFTYQLHMVNCLDFWNHHGIWYTFWIKYYFYIISCILSVNWIDTDGWLTRIKLQQWQEFLNTVPAFNLDEKTAEDNLIGKCICTSKQKGRQHCCSFFSKTKKVL